MLERIPFTDVTANELNYQERDDLYDALHKREETTAMHEYGLQLIWKHADVREVLRAEHPDISNTNSLDPLDGFGPIMRNPKTYGAFIRHLVPLPARATANAEGPEHRHTWTIMTNFFRGSRYQLTDQYEQHFHAAVRENTNAASEATLDITKLSIDYASRITGEAIGVARSDWPQLAAWSKAQSGLLGQRLRGQDQAVAVASLGELFSLSKQTILQRERKPEADLASALLQQGCERAIAVSALANCLAAGVHTIAGTLQQGTQRILSPGYREWWESLPNYTRSMHVSQKLLQLDPGLVGWKRTITRPTTLQSGTQLQKGEVVALFAAANRDPAVFSDPYALQARAQLLTFGSGEHVCPGRNMATMATWVFMRQLVALAPNAEIIPNDNPQPRARDLLFSGADVTITTG